MQLPSLKRLWISKEVSNPDLKDMEEKGKGIIERMRKERGMDVSSYWWWWIKYEI